MKGLRVADGSIMPDIVSGNTNAPIIMIGEKCANLIKDDIGYKEGGNMDGANGLDDVGFEKLFNDAINGGKQHSGATDFDFVNRMWNEAVENGQKKRRKRSIASNRQLNSTNSLFKRTRSRND